MWYTNTIVLKQNPNFYDQIDNQNNLIASKNNEFLPNKIDTTEYTLECNLGAVLKSTEKKHPKAGDTRVVYDKYFYCSNVIKRGFRKYECWWCSSQLKDLTEIKNFKKQILGV